MAPQATQVHHNRRTASGHPGQFVPMPRRPTKDDAIVCASCPAMMQEEVGRICKRSRIMKAFGVHASAAPQTWSVANWEWQVLVCVTALVQERDAKRVRILCVEGDDHAEEQTAAQQHLLQRIRAELNEPSFPIRVEWMPYQDFSLEFDCHQHAASIRAASTSALVNQKCGRHAGTSDCRTTEDTIESLAVHEANPVSAPPCARARRNRSHSRGGNRRRTKEADERSTVAGGRQEFSSTLESRWRQVPDATSEAHTDATCQCPSSSTQSTTQSRSGNGKDRFLGPTSQAQCMFNEGKENPNTQQHHPTMKRSASWSGSASRCSGTSRQLGDPSAMVVLSQKPEEWPDLIQASKTRTRGSSRLRTSSASSHTGNHGQPSTQQSQPRKTRCMQPRRDPIAIVWTCQECHASFPRQEELIDHQQREWHFSPTLESGRTFVRKFDHHSKLSGPTQDMNSGPSTCQIEMSCECYAMSPRGCSASDTTMP